MSDNLFREVDEDLQRDRYMRLWRRYGRFLSAGVVGIVALTVAWVGWQQYDLGQRRALSDRFASAVAMADDGNPSAAINALERMAGEAAGGYAALARLRAASLLVEDGDPGEAILMFDAVAADTSAPEWMRDLSTILSVQHGLTQADPVELERRLAPLATETSPWRFTARELTALAAMQAGDRERALDLFRALADAFDAPAQIRGRAAEMLAAMER